MIYPKNVDDVQFRVFSMRNAMEPRFEDFAGSEINFNEREEVVEIKHADGTCSFVVTNIEPEDVYYQGNGSGVFTLPAAVPAARIWVKPSGSSVMYKVPAVLPKTADAKALVTFEIHSSDPGVSLVGDEYFNKIYRLTRR